MPASECRNAVERTRCRGVEPPGIRPDSYASRPASTASFMARAIFTGFLAAAMPVFISTAVAPSSMATAASLAVPTPASTITGTSTVSMMMRRFAGFRMPRPEPIGAASGMTAAQPIASRRWQATGSSEM